MNAPERIHCRFCEQDYVSSQFDKCSLCGKVGGIVRPNQPNNTTAITASPGTVVEPSRLELLEKQLASVLPEDPKLGAVLVACRRAPSMAQLRDIVPSIIGLVIWPFVLLPFGSLMISLAFMAMIGHDKLADMLTPVFIATFLVIYTTFLWNYFTRIFRHCFLLCEKGLIYRDSNLELALTFEAIHCCWFGNRTSNIDHDPRTVPPIDTPEKEDWLNAIGHQAFNLFVKDGTHYFIKGLWKTYDKRDLIRFFDQLSMRNARLFTEPIPSPEVAAAFAYAHLRRSWVWRHPLLIWSVLAIGFFGTLAVSLWLPPEPRPIAKPAPVPVVGQPFLDPGKHHVEKGKSQYVQIKIQKGQILNLRLKVDAGDVVNAIIGTPVETDGKWGLREAKEFGVAVLTKSYDWNGAWNHPHPAIVLLSTEGTADVTLTAEIVDPKK